LNKRLEEESRLTGKYSTKKKAKGKEKDSKPLTIKKHLLNSLLDPNGEEDDIPQQPTYVQEQAALRSEMVEAFRTAVADEDEEDDGLLVLREKAQHEEEGEEYGDFLQKEAGEEIKRFLGGIGERSDEPGANDESVHGEEESGKKKKKKKKKKDKEAKEGGESSRDGKARKGKEEEDQDFLMKYVLLDFLVCSLTEFTVTSLIAVG
jgi:protein KRI1